MAVLLALLNALQRILWKLPRCSIRCLHAAIPSRPLTRSQTWSIKHPNTPAPSIGDAVKNHLGGSAGLYRGVCSTLLRDIPFSMLFFSMHGVIQVCEHRLQRSLCPALRAAQIRD